MSNASTNFQIVGSDDFPEYPISVNDRLDAHYFLQWNLSLWDQSDFRKKCDPEVGWYGLNLFFIAHKQLPIGTLSTDEEILAHDLSISVAHWRKLMSYEITPLQNWHRVRCDNGQIRWAHHVCLAVAEKAIKSRRAYITKASDERLRKRMGTIKAHLAENVPGGKMIAQNETQMGKINDWIEENYPGGNATSKRIFEAWEALSCM